MATTRMVTTRMVTRQRKTPEKPVRSRLGSALTDCALLLGLAAIASMVLLLSVLMLGKWILGTAASGCQRSARALKGPALRQTLARLPVRR